MVSKDAYRDTLVKLVMSIGRMGGLIVGRGAHVVLSDACALRVRVTGSPEVCARRMAERGHGSFEAELADELGDLGPGGPALRDDAGRDNRPRRPRRR